MMYENISIVEEASTLAKQLELGNGSQLQQWDDRAIANLWARGQITTEEALKWE